MNALLAAIFGAVAGLAIAPAVAQQVQPTEQGSAILTVTQERLFLESRMGRGVQSRFESASRILAAENRRIEAALEQEERDLTARRATLPAEEFRKLAGAFDSKVEQIRAAQEGKSRTLTRQRDEDRQKMLEAAAPILAQIMAEQGAAVLLDKSAIILSFDRIDITDAAILRLDAVLGDGDATPPAPAEPSPPAEPATP